MVPPLVLSLCSPAWPQFDDASLNSREGGDALPLLLRGALTIVCNEELQFGTIIPYQGGTVTLRPQGNHRTTTGSVVLMTTPPGRAAEFTVMGEKNAIYALILPTSAVLTRVAGHQTMTVDEFTSHPVSGTGRIGGNGRDRFKVGATLHVGAAQAPGVYRGTFPVIVNYE